MQPRQHRSQRAEQVVDRGKFDPGSEPTTNVLSVEFVGQMLGKNVVPSFAIPQPR